MEIGPHRDAIRKCSGSCVSNRADRYNNERPYPLVEVVAAELYSRVGDDSNAIGSVAAHEPSPSLLFPHLAQRLSNRQLVRISSSALYLHEDLQPFEG